MTKKSFSYDRDESDARESWWVEIRQEVRSHAKALGCNMIVGYQEKTVIWYCIKFISGFEFYENHLGRMCSFCLLVELQLCAT